MAKMLDERRSISLLTIRRAEAPSTRIASTRGLGPLTKAGHKKTHRQRKIRCYVKDNDAEAGVH